jgi:cobaltochelatase CobN
MSFFIQGATFAADIVFLVLDANSYLANRSVTNLDPELGKRVVVGSAAELLEDPQQWQQELMHCDIVIVDVMGKELEEFVSKTIAVSNSKQSVYALRGSSDDEYLKKEGYIFDETITAYYAHISELNITNILRLVIHRHLDSDITYAPV